MLMQEETAQLKRTIKIVHITHNRTTWDEVAVLCIILKTIKISKHKFGNSSYSQKLLFSVYSIQNNTIYISLALWKSASYRHDEIPVLKYLTMTFKTNSIICITSSIDLQN